MRSSSKVSERENEAGDWLILKMLGLGKASSGWIMKGNSKQLEFVDSLIDWLHERNQIIAGFPRTLQTNHIPFPNWPESWQTWNEALIQTPLDRLYLHLFIYFLVLATMFLNKHMPITLIFSPSLRLMINEYINSMNSCWPNAIFFLLFPQVIWAKMIFLGKCNSH